MIRDFSIDQYAHSGEHCHFISWDNGQYVVVRYLKTDRKVGIFPSTGTFYTTESVLNCSSSCKALKKDIVHFTRGGSDGTEYLVTDYSYCHLFNQPLHKCEPCKECQEHIIDPLTMLEL